MLEVILSVAMFFAGGIGALCAMYLQKISRTLEAQAALVADIDKRVVAVETRMKVAPV